MGFYESAPKDDVGQEMILRDYLALDRTRLANQRTLLAFARTAIMLIATGITFMKLFDDRTLFITGILFLPLAGIVSAIGLRSYVRTAWALKKAISADQKSRSSGDSE